MARLALLSGALLSPVFALAQQVSQQAEATAPMADAQKVAVDLQPAPATPVATTSAVPNVMVNEQVDVITRDEVLSELSVLLASSNSASND